MARIWNKPQVEEQSSLRGRHKQTPFDYAQGKNTPLKRKVFVAMSGGIDSSVAAALLKGAGSCPEPGRRIDVIGVFMKFWAESEENEKKCGWNRCCSPDSEKRARQVAKILKIPFYVFNFEKEFKKRIVDYFLKEYKAGRTPNPCVVCNKEIKFGLFLEKALELKADYIATGHYAKKIQNLKSKIQKLYMGKDKEKDQSYFLWQLNQQQLDHILFPLGNYTKDKVRGLAKKFRLPFKKVPESMEVCFIPKDVNDFLKKYLRTKPGAIVEQVHNRERKTIGQHQGLWFYTIGQRKGIGLSGGPYFVLEKDEKNNVLVVTKKEKDLFEKELSVENINWILGKEPKLPLKVQARIRYRGKLAKAVIDKPLGKNVYTVRFKVSQRAMAPGQSAVFYLPAVARSSKQQRRCGDAKAGMGQELVGGGIIKKVDSQSCIK